jgi:hypothetical protein
MRFPRPRATLPPGPMLPAPTEASARPGGLEAPAGGGAGAGRGLWPPAGLGSAGRSGRGDGPCQRYRASRHSREHRPSGREKETHCVSPARAERCPQDPCHPNRQRPAPDPAGEKRPPGAGRALAGGFGPPAGQGSAWRCGRGDGPCHCSGEGAFVGAGGTRKRTAFPRPRATLPPRPVHPAPTEASA